MKTKRVLWGLFAAAALSQTGCGGGSGSTVSGPAAAAPSAPSIESSKQTLAQLSADCSFNGINNPCIPFISATVDDNGETTVLWSQHSQGGSGELHAANFAATGNTTLSSGVIEQGFFSTTSRRAFQVNPLGPRRFLVLDREQELTSAGPIPVPPPALPGTPMTGPEIHARIVETASSGTPTVGARKLLPAQLYRGTYFPALVKASNGALYAFAADSRTASPPVDLGGGQLFTVLPNPNASFDQIKDWSLASFPQSIATALWAVADQSATTGEQHVYLSTIALDTGVAQAPSRLSTQPYVSCGGSELQVQATSAANTIVAWRQKKETKNGCDLVINGIRVNDGVHSVGRFSVAGKDGAIIAVWSETNDTTFRRHLLWSRLEASGGTFSVPAPLGLEYTAAGGSQEALTLASGPDGTLAVAWRPWTSTGLGSFTTDNTLLISKHVNGVWSTAFAGHADSLAISINGKGQGTVLTSRSSSCGAAACSELAAYRF